MVCSASGRENGIQSVFVALSREADIRRDRLDDLERVSQTTDYTTKGKKTHVVLSTRRPT